MKSKTIILSDPNGKNSARGIFTIYYEDDIYKCKMRLYNSDRLTRFHKLGIYQKEVLSANLLEKNGSYLSSIVGDFDIGKDFYCAIVDTEHDNIPVLAGGTYGGLYFSESDLFSSIEKDDYVETFSSHYDQAEEENVQISTSDDNENFQTQISPENSIELNLEKEISLEQPQIVPNDNVQKTNLQEMLKNLSEQFDYVFSSYPQDNILCGMLPHSKFVEIKENDDKYSIGALYENENIKYICYAVFATYKTPAPKEIGEHYQWLPLDADDPLSDGYFIVFQDSTDFKIVEL